MNRILCCFAALLFFAVQINAQTVFNPADPVYTYNSGTSSGSVTNPTVPSGNTIKKWVRKNRMSWNTDKYKCYTIGGSPFRLRYPNTYVPGVTDGKKFPVIVFFHGGGEALTDPYDNEYMLFNGAQRFGQYIDNGMMDAYVLFLQTPYVDWNNTQFSSINIVLDSIIKNCKADEDRIIPMGLSIGGAVGAINYAEMYPKRAARIIPSAPAFITTFNNGIPGIIHIPMWIGSGGLDNNPDPGSVYNYVNAFTAQGGDIIYSLYPNQSHVMWDYQWSEPFFSDQWNQSHKANPLVFFNKKQYACGVNTISSKLGITPGFFQYEWSKDGTTIAGATSNEYTATAFGVYRVRFKRTSTSAFSEWSPNPAVISSLCPGTGTGLTANYYNNTSFTAPAALTRVDPTVNLSLLGSSVPDPAVNHDNISVRWTGKVQPLYSETYTFYTTSDDGVRLWVNGQLVIDNFSSHASTENSGTIALLAGQKYDIRMDYFNGCCDGAAVLKWSSASVTKAVIPQTQLYPDPVTACISGNVPANGATVATQTSAVLSWTAVPTATSYEVYVWSGTTPPETPTATVTAPSYNAGGLTASTQYKWNVIAKNISGAATTCSANSTSFTTNGPLPACANNSLPVNGSTIGTQTSATLNWNNVAAATSYEVYIWTGPTAPTMPTATVATNAYAASNLIAGTLYNWYVIPRNASGPATGCALSNTTTFTTAAVVIPVPVCATNSLPANGAVLATQTTAALSWSAVATAVSYDVYIWTGATPPALPTTNVPTNSYNASALVAGTLYNWYVAPRNASGPATGCALSNTTTFTTAAVVIPVPVCATNSLPANGAVLATQTTAALSWSAVATAVSYDVYIWTGATPPALPTTNVPTNSYNASALVAGTLYNWYVAPRNASGPAVGCDLSNKSTFTTAVAVPVCAINTLPANGAVLATQTTAALSWGAVATATSYDVYIWTGATPPALPTTNVPTNSYNASALVAGTLYNWYVAPRNASGPAVGCDLSNKSTFTTAVAVPVCAINTLPANGSTLATQTTASLTWGAVATATSYDVYIWTGTTPPALPTTNVPTNSYNASALVAGTLYNWYVAPRNASGPAVGCDLSNKSTFTTAVAVPVCAINTLPANGSTLATQTTASLTWGAVANATSYDVYIWTGATPPALPTTNVPTNSYNASALVAGTLYNWYVAPRNASGPAVGCDLSNKSTFTTTVAVPVCAINTLPANGSTLATQTTASLTWGAVANATSYDVYIWTGATPPALPTTNVPTNSYNASALVAGTLYNWYVAPRNASGPAVGCDLSNKSTFTTAVAVPVCAINTLPANGSTLATQTTASLTWGAVANATSYDVYIWTGATPPALPTTNVPTNSYNASALVAGTLYNWYVAPRNASGPAVGCDVSNKSTFTTAVAVPVCAINTLPANGSTLATQTTASLTWGAVATATSYDVYIWTGATPPALPTTNVPTNSYNASALVAGTLYNWYVAPRNASGPAVGCDLSNKSTFTTASSVVLPPVCAINALPSDGSTIATQTIATLTWNSVVNATSYAVYIWSGLTPPVSPTATVTDNSYIASFLTGSTLYNWYVVPTNAGGPASGCDGSSITTFNTAAIPVPVCATNSLPANGAVLTTQTTAALSWSAVATAVSYDVYIWTGATPPALPTTNVPTNSYNASALVAGTLYNWYVAPRNASGPAVGCDLSNKSTFTTAVAVPVCAINSLPANGAVLATQTTAALSWGAVATATSYDVYIWTGATPPALPTTNVPTNSYNASALVAGTLYNWYVAPRNASGPAVGCDVSNKSTFTTAVAVPVCAINTLPANGSTLATQTTASLTWGAVANATSYDVYIWTGATPPALPTTNVPTNSYNASALVAGTLYNWYVAPRNASGPAVGCDLSNKSTFTTAVAVPVCAINSLPANGAVLATQTTAALSWSAVATAVSYDVYIWTGATPPALPTTNVPTNSYNASALVAGTLYNWYVAPRNASGPATGCALSNTTTFTTAAVVIPVPVCATNSLPVNGAVLGTQTTAALSWGAVATATSYDVYIWTGATPPALPTTNVPTNSYNASALVAGTLYNWYVAPRNASGPAVGCDLSNKSTFTTTVAVPVCAINTLPANGSTLATQTTASLTWGAVATATSYDVYIWTGATPPALPTTNVPTNSYNASALVAGTLYNWYVAPRNASGPATGCALSNTTTFTTAAVVIPVPVCAINSLPANGAVLATQTTAALSWSAVSTAVSYDVYIWTGATPPALPTTNVPTNSYNASALVAGTLYNWYVAPRNASGPAVGCDLSNKSTFTTAVAVPVCATNSLPANGAVLATQTTAALSWSAVATAVSYDVYIWTGATPPALPTTNVPTNSYNASALVAGTLYNWYVAPRNASGPAVGCDLSNKSTFTTAVASVPGTGTGLRGEYFNNITLTNPVIVSRIDPTVNFNWLGAASPAASVTSDNFSVRWTGKVEAVFNETYTFYTRSDDGARLWVNGVQLVNDFNNHATTENSAAITLVAGQKYDIRMEYYDGCCDAVAQLLWSSASTPKAIVPQIRLYPDAIVIPAPPACVVNSAPVNGSTLISQTTATLTWPAAATATSYDVYLWTGATPPTVPTTTTAAISYTVNTLTASTLYNWYVVPKNGGGDAAGCAVSNRTSFTTAAVPGAGTGTGLKAEYFNNTSITDPVIATRIDPTINFTWLGNTSPAASVTGDNFSVRWTGKVQPVFSETYTFFTQSDDGVRLWVNGVQLVNNFTNHGSTENSGTITLVGGQKYDIRLEYYDACCDAVAQLRWSSASTPKAIIPQTQLYPDAIVTPAPPTCVVNSAPVNGSTIATQTTATLTWASSATATSYDVFLWTGATPPTVPTANVTTVSYGATGLIASTLYNWYVVPKNGGGDAVSCIVSNRTSFTTAAVAGAGTGTGLKGEYFNNTTLSNPVVLTRTDQTINFAWIGAAAPDPSVNNDNFSVRWTGKVQPVFSETYTFYTSTDDGARLWVNGVQLVNDFNNHGTTENSGSITLAAGQKYDIRMEYFDGCCDGIAALLWSSASTPKTIIPKTQLYLPDAALVVAAPLAATATADLTAAVTTITSSVSPNPVSPGQSVRLQINSNHAVAASVQIINSNGNVISIQKVNLLAGINTTNVNTSALGQGFYILRITGGDKPVNIKLLVE